MSEVRISALSKTTGPRRLDIQGLRAFAVLSVIAFHAGLPVPGGFIGVDVFFVISGFVITRMLLRERSAQGRISLASFYWRRFKRIAPALSVMLTVCLLLAIPVLSPFGEQQTAARTGIATVLLVSNLAIARSTGDYFGGPAEGNLFLNTWSLSVEEQFYLFLPILLVLIWALIRSARWRSRSSIALLAAVAMLSFLLAVLGSTGYTLDRYFWLLGFFSPLTRIWEFAAGGLLALAALRNLPAVFGSVASTVGAVLLVVSLGLISDSTPWPGVWTLIPVLGTVLVIAGGSIHPEAPASRVLQLRPLSTTGDYSYSLYLWHWPVIVLAVAIWGRSIPVQAVAAVAAVVPAILFYRTIERPIHKATITRMRLRILAVFAFTAAPLAVAWVVLQGSAAVWWIPLPDRPLFGSQSIGLTECMRFVRHTGDSPLADARCQIVEPKGGRPIYLVGDSQAGQWAEGIASTAEVVGGPANIAVAPGCPFIDVYTGSAAGMGADDHACRETYEANLDLLLHSPPGDVVIAQSLAYWIDSQVEVARTEGGWDGTRKWQHLGEGILSTVRTLERAGHRVYVVVPTLQLADEGNSLLPFNCSFWMVVRDECFQAVELAEVSPDQVQAREEIGEVLSRAGVTTIDPLDLQCPNGLCELWNGSVPIYADSSHVSAEFSQLAYPLFVEILSESRAP